ncbi:hypothetical protein [Thetidibacter halocola]|uniref:Uncharacterized protein n=1 Tax=Thetidibacter halocola TaxID=2827239 RepID=A0A8J8B662_9RHOB|nr:hypothetical protein [Thetidibacter halocola]MBS0123676.1 hypothetical protein [Thetidibacter halocola]
MLEAERTSELAHALYRAQGDRAEAFAARRERESTDSREAENWRVVRAAIRRIRGANQG